MLEIPEFLKKSAENCGFVRESYNESKMPTTSRNITVLPFFGDSRADFVLSTLLLKRYREEIKGSKYFILCSWPGRKFLYPFVDEYWSIKDLSTIREFYLESCGFRNNSDILLNYYKDLNQCFYEVLDIKELERFYNNGLTDDFMGAFHSIKRFLPMIPSKGILGTDFNRVLANRSGLKIILCPYTHIKIWRNKVENRKISKDFWIALVERLLKEGYVPIIVNNFQSHDLTIDFNQRDCVFFPEYDMAKILSMMRAGDCVLDIFTDFSRLAGIARMPYVQVTERFRYMKEKDFELDDLCLDRLPKQYIFSFTTIIEKGTEQQWNLNIFDNIVARLNSFLEDLDSDDIPTASELSEEVSYKSVRVRKLKQLGIKFIKVPKEE